jgi:hypothetical protein
VTIHHRDASNFDLDAKFPLVIAPFRVMQHMTTIEQQLACARVSRACAGRSR